MKTKHSLSIKFILLMIVIGGLIFLLFFNPYLEIRNWEVEGVELAKKKDIVVFLEKLTEKKVLFVPQNNFFVFLIKRNNIIKLLETQFKEIESASISFFFNRNFFNEIKIEIKKRTEEGIICPSSCDFNCFFFDCSSGCFHFSDF